MARVPTIKKPVDRPTKTNHQTGYHKRSKNPTTNYAPSSKKEFCKRCFAQNHGCVSADPKGCSL